MSEFDLVPDSYRRARSVRRGSRWVVASYAVALVLVVSLLLDLRGEVSSLDTAHTRAQAEQQLATNMLEELNRVQAAAAAAAARLAVLEQLRGGPAVARLFSAIDAAMIEGVWLARWTFRRAGEPLAADATEAGSVVPPYLTLVKLPDRPAWQLGSHMEIDGEARGHTELALFVERLLASGDIAEVQILNTTLSRDAASVAFSLAVVVNDVGEVAGRDG